MNWNRASHAALSCARKALAGPVAALFSWRRDGTRQPGFSAPALLAVLFIFLAAGIMMVGFLYYRNYRNHHRAEVERQLLAIADLKTHDIVHWRTERIGNGKALYGNTALNALADRLFLNPGDVNARRQIQSWFQSRREGYNIAVIFLLDGNGAVQLESPENLDVHCCVMPSFVEQARDSRQIVLTDFHRESPTSPIHLSVIVPIIDLDRPQGRVNGFIVMVFDPDDYLFPLISRWPTESRSAETLLVRREGDSVLFLNNLRFYDNAAMNLRIPLTNRRVPAVQAALGREGIVEGTDYRGVRVLAALKKIPDSSWSMVARVDMSEVLEPVREKFWSVGAAVLGMVLAAGAAAGMLWRRQNARFLLERVRSAEALREGEQRMRSMLDAMLEGCQIIGFDWTYRYLNDAAARHGRRPMEQLIGRSFVETWPGIERTELYARIRRCMEEREPHRMENEFRYPDGVVRWFDLSILPVPEGVFILSIDITGRREAEASLRASEEKYRRIVDTSNEGIWGMSASHETDFVNSRMAEMMGYAVEEMLGRPVEFFMFEEDLADHAGKMENRHAGGDDRYERRFRRKDGSELWTIVSATALVGEDGGFMGSFAMFTDITDRKLSEIRVRESLREKEVLLKEIHHRVKNNLQMIVSLLNIQKQRIDSRELAEELSVLQNRVTAIAHIHEALYGSESFSKIRFDDYARSILHDLSYVYAATSRGIHVREELNPVDLTIEQAIPCGLILNELLTNSFKHAFADTGNDGKTLTLGVSRDGDVVTLAVSDNGVGMPEKGDNVLKHVSGLDIVDVLLKQIHGTLATSVDNGTLAVVTFRIRD